MKSFKQTKIKFVVVAAGIIAAPFILVGCNTIEGAGTDIKHAGGALEHAAEEAKQPCPPTPPCPPRTRSQQIRR